MKSVSNEIVWLLQSLQASDSFQHILRVLNTNVDGKEKVMYALTAIKGIGRRFANVACKKAEVDMSKRCEGLVCVPPKALSTAFL